MPHRCPRGPACIEQPCSDGFQLGVRGGSRVSGTRAAHGGVARRQADARHPALAKRSHHHVHHGSVVPCRGVRSTARVGGLEHHSPSRHHSDTEAATEAARGAVGLTLHERREVVAPHASKAERGSIAPFVSHGCGASAFREGSELSGPFGRRFGTRSAALVTATSCPVWAASRLAPGEPHRQALRGPAAPAGHPQSSRLVTGPEAGARPSCAGPRNLPPTGSPRLRSKRQPVAGRPLESRPGHGV